ncbi:hypothetical protein SOCEGT47_027980 [Sorangium cellulosum]|uniref:Uncharacterized protein n=1 Tax=Sorangium cellulosum TaxID=56 RepID=A0A4P2PZE9_SORCE|nr:hypothetical protein [Sorangium cellulosum]AUX22297.1 hypothetical protein SOCEGT47_027980 [Sorangium cellulosum]
MQLRSKISCALPLLLAACGDPQVGSDYPGEALLTIEGTIVNELGVAPPGQVEAVLVWNTEEGPSDVENFPVRASATGSFPASFTLSIHAPPPVIALNDFSEHGVEGTRVGIATIVAALDEASAEEGASLGVDEDHVLVYVESEMVEGGFWSNFFGGRLSPGFHVMDVLQREGEVDAELQAAFDACNAAATTEAEHNACYGYDVKLKIRPSADGADATLTVRMAPPEDLTYPDWH